MRRRLVGESNDPKTVPIALLGIAFASLMAWDIRVLAMPVAERVQFVPDDGFYYLSLGRSFATLGRWTADAGRTVTSGFHPAWGWLLAGLQAVTGAGRDGFLAVAFAACCVLSWAALAIPLAWPLRGPRWPLHAALAVVVASPVVATNSVSLTEWPVCVLCSGLYVWALLRDGRRRMDWVLFAAGCAGSLARSEFGVLPFALLAARVLLGSRASRGPRIPRLAAGLAGAVAGIAAGLLHNLAFTGEPFQSSARMKLHWGLVEGAHDPLMPLGLLIRLATGVEINGMERFIVVGTVAGVLLLVPAVRAARRIATRELGDTEAVLLTGGLLTLAAVVGLYSRGLVPQLWYASMMTVPLVLVLRGLLGTLAGARARTAALAVAATIVAADAGTVHVLRVAPWPWQARLLEAGRYAEARAWNGAVGSWNSGVIGYYSGGRVINLDGLVNNEVVPWIMAGRLEGYLAEKGIRYLLDFEGMVTPRYERRGGFDAGRLRRSVVRSVVVSRETRPEAQVFGPAVRLWEIVPRGPAR